MTDPRSRSHPDFPTLAHQAWAWAVDGMIEDRITKGKGEWTDEDEELADLIEAAVCKVLCDRYGHEVMDDQCMIPGHRFCQWCRIGMPNMPIGKLTKQEAIDYALRTERLGNE